MPNDDAPRFLTQRGAVGCRRPSIYNGKCSMASPKLGKRMVILFKLGGLLIRIEAATVKQGWTGRGKGVGQQFLHPGVVCGEADEEKAVPVEQPFGPPQNGQGALVGFEDAAPLVHTYQGSQSYNRPFICCHFGTFWNLQTRWGLNSCLCRNGKVNDFNWLQF